MTIFDIFSKYQLTANQQDLVKKLDVFLTNKSQECFLLQGYAGTGKTFITKGLTEYFKAQHRRYILAAPTGKASKVISQKTSVPAYTIHKTIYSDKDIKEYKTDKLDGTETYKFYYELRVNDDDAQTVYIIDEASMIADVYQEDEFFRFGSGFVLKDLLKYINIDNNNHNKKIIFIGDNAQLPPVGMKFSPALSSQYLSKNYGLTTTAYELTEVVRQSKSSGILQNSITLRNTLKDRMFNTLDIKLNYDDVTHVEHTDLLPEYLKACDNKISDEAIIIAHSNNYVKKYNDRIREVFFPGNKEIAVDDKVMATSNSKYQILISNGDFGIVKSISQYPEQRTITLKTKNKESNEVHKIEVPLSFRSVVIEFIDLEGHPHNIECKIIENLLYSSEPKLSSDQNKAIYIDFVTRHPGLKPGTPDFKGAIQRDPYFNSLKIKFGYAITCHKAQGSEWNQVFINCDSHTNKMSEGYFRWLYTAITRASKKLYTLDEPHYKYGSTMKHIRQQNTNRIIEMKKTPSQSIEVNNKQELFGISSEDIFLLTLLSKVKELTEPKKIKIVDIQHYEYHEVYSFKYNNNQAEIKIYYNGKNIISHINKTHNTKLSDGLLRVLQPLEKLMIGTVQTENNKNCVISFTEDFLKKQYEFLTSLGREKAILVNNVAHHNYLEKYFFKREDEFAVFDFYYNGKKQFTHWTPESGKSNSKALINDIVSMIEEFIV
jgi:hypothetical protein